MNGITRRSTIAFEPMHDNAKAGEFRKSLAAVKKKAVEADESEAPIETARVTIERCVNARQSLAASDLQVSRISYRGRHMSHASFPRAVARRQATIPMEMRHLASNY